MDSVRIGILRGSCEASHCLLPFQYRIQVMHLSTTIWSQWWISQYAYHWGIIYNFVKVQFFRPSVNMINALGIFHLPPSPRLASADYTLLSSILLSVWPLGGTSNKQVKRRGLSVMSSLHVWDLYLMWLPLTKAYHWL